MIGFLIWSGFLEWALYALANNWASHVPPGSGAARKIGVLAGYSLLVWFCLAGIVGALHLKAQN